MIETKNKLNGIFQKVFNNPDLRVEHYMKASDVEGWDSFNHLRLIMFIEKEFDIQIDGSEVMTFKNVGDMIHFIEQRKR